MCDGAFFKALTESDAGHKLFKWIRRNVSQKNKTVDDDSKDLYATSKKNVPEAQKFCNVNVKTRHK